MAISDTQKVDYLWKKLGYGATKTDTNANKLAPNEAISSPLLLRGDKVWQQAADIPTVQPGSSAGVVTVYPTSSPQECTADNTATANRSWKTGVTDWIPPEVGSTYQAKVYIATASDAGNASSGDQVFATGSGNNDEWFFDYQSGVLHFIGTNLPDGVSFTGKSVYVAGARYTGTFGVGSTGGTDANVGNLTIADTTITSTTSGDDITIDAEGGSFIISGTTGFVIPVGTTAQRDGSPATGTLRYNSTTGGLEIYDGTTWDTVGDSSATVDSFDGDNSTTAFTMTADSTTDGTIVDINGVVQLPTTAYTVSGNVITFTQAPASGDKITTRLLVTMVGTTAQAAGSDQEIQFNSGDVLSASSNLTFNNSTNILTSPVIATNEIASPDSTILILNDDVQINGLISTDSTMTATGNITGGNITTSGLTSTANLTVTGNGLFNSGVQEAFDTLTGSTGTVTHNCDNGHIFYHTGASGDITANFTNLSLTAEYGTNLTVIINQGATPYEVTAVQIGGVAQTINWQGGSQPTGNANGIDSFSFTILNDGGTYVVLGQMVDFT
ncbi:MAG: hypothetical protein EB168_02295 [Euryarchaeota archaeon]|nr:hypothetical protein [Euryarchaeota archaeon]